MPTSWTSGKPLPDPTTSEQLNDDPRYIQWKDIAKSHFACTGKEAHFGEVRKWLGPQIEAKLIEETDYLGWFRFTDRGWELYKRVSLKTFR
jgi:hypothetical protein